MSACTPVSAVALLYKVIWVTASKIVCAYYNGDKVTAGPRPDGENSWVQAEECAAHQWGAERLREEEAMRDTQLRAAAALTSADGAGQVDRTGELVKHLHDSLAQLLSFALIQLDTAQGARAGVRESALRHSRQLVKEALRSTRGLIGDLREGARVELLAFDQQLLQMAADVSRLSQRDLQLACQPLPDALPLPVSKMLLRAARELLVNACKHAPSAAIQLSLRSSEDGKGIVLSVSDDGPGLDPHALQAESASSYGLRQLPACLALIGAELQLFSQPGAGLCACILWRPQVAEAQPVGRQMTGSDEVGQ